MEFFIELEELLRESESSIFDIERIIFSSQYDFMTKHKEILANQSIAMMYSIWERFIQKAFGLYCKELNRRKIAYKEFSDNIILFCIEMNYPEINNFPKEKNKKIKFINKLHDFYTDGIITLPTIINTNSNVGFRQMNRILKQFEVEPFPEYWNKYTFPNLSLKMMMGNFIDLRNSVSHGGDIGSENKINHAVYSQYKYLIIDLMYEINDRIEFSLEKEAFLKTNALKK